MYRLADGVSPEDFRLPSNGVAEIKIDSYRQFREMQQAGDIPAGVRFQATLPGPMTTGGVFYMPLSVGAQAAGNMIIGEIQAIAAAVPHDQLAIQLDLAVELESIELQRRPDAFDLPVFKIMFEGWGDWNFEDVVEQVLRVARAVPDDVELGFHLCGAWHIDHRGGQDLQVHVDFANALTDGLSRPIGYIHVPTVPEHDGEDFAPLADLRLGPDTRFYLGVIHQDGPEGARRRIEAATKYRQDFGVAHFCGLNPIFEVDPATLEDFLALHAQVAEG